MGKIKVLKAKPKSKKFKPRRGYKTQKHIYKKLKW